MDNPDNWVWIWLVAAAGFGIGEILAAGTFFLLPFSGGALAALVVSLVGGGIALQWIAFLAASVAALAALRPIARRLDRDYPSDGIGAAWLRGAEGVVIDAIPEGRSDLGMVRVERDEWRAESLDGRPIAQGSRVRVAEVKGTRVVVFPVEIGSDPDTGLLGPDGGEPDA